MRGILGAVVMAVTVVLSHAAHAESVAVVVVGNVNLSADEADQIGNKIARAIERTFDAQATGSSDTRRAYPEGLPADCANQAACQQRLAERLGARYLLFLTAVKMGGRVQIDPLWAEPGKGLFGVRGAQSLDPASATAGTYTNLANLLVPIGALPRRRIREMTTASWVGVGAAGVFALTAAGLGTWAILRHDDCESGDGCSQAQFDKMEDDVKLRRTLADVFFGGAIAAGTVAAVLYFTSDSNELEQAPAVSVMTDGDSFAIGWGGRF